MSKIYAHTLKQEMGGILGGGKTKEDKELFFKNMKKKIYIWMRIMAAVEV